MMSNSTKIIFRESPLLEISFDNKHIHIVDFENPRNNEVFYYNDIKIIEFINGNFKIESLNKQIEVGINEKKISAAENIVSEIIKFKSSKDILYPREKYKQESFENFTERYNGFGKNLYLEIKNRYPEIFEKLKFYQMLEDKEDSYAEYIDTKIPFVIQLDYYGELIILSDDEKKHIEIGTWDKNEVQKSINYILNELLT